MDFPARVCLVTASMGVISNRVQAAYSADKCSDTADETVRLLHLKDWSDLERLAKESLLRQNVATTGGWRVLLWLLSLFSACVSHGGRRSVAFVPRCEIHHSFPEPPSPPWISGMSESTKALSADNGASILNVTHPCVSSFQTSSNSLPLSRFSWSYSHNSAHTVVATGHSRSWIFTFPSFTFASPPVAPLPNGRTIFFRWARIRWSMSPVRCIYTGPHDELPLALGWSNGTC